VNLVKSGSIYPAGKAHGAYLALSRVPAAEWGRFYPGEKDLYTLWTRKLVPVLADRARISRADLPDADRALTLALLDAVASRSVTMGRTGPCESSAPLIFSVAGEVALLGEETRVDLVIRLPLHPEEARGEISLRGRSAYRELALKLEWQPQADPGRGSILLYPRAAKPQYRFVNAAYNRRQFVNICKALVDYSAPGLKLTPAWLPPDRPHIIAAARAEAIPSARDAMDVSHGATRIPRSESERWAD
jgi:hypothetical protein